MVADHRGANDGTAQRGVGWSGKSPSSFIGRRFARLGLRLLRLSANSGTNSWVVVPCRFSMLHTNRSNDLKSLAPLIYLACSF